MPLQIHLSDWAKFLNQIISSIEKESIEGHIDSTTELWERWASASLPHQYYGPFYHTDESKSHKTLHTQESQYSTPSNNEDLHEKQR